MTKKCAQGLRDPRSAGVSAYAASGTDKEETNKNNIKPTLKPWENKEIQSIYMMFVLTSYRGLI